MNYEIELNFLRDIFKKCRVSVSGIKRGDPIDRLLDENFKLFFAGGENFFTDVFFEQIKPNVIYRLSTDFNLCYIFLKLPDISHEIILSIGPYMSQFPQERKILEAGEKYNIPPQRQKLLERFLSNIPHIAQNSHLFTLLDTFAERIWGASNFEVVDVNENFLVKNHILTTDIQSGTEDIYINMKLMEERYAAENEMMRAISQGKMHKVANLLSNFSAMSFEKRLDDPLRNLKNYGIIMNTLLRKAAEQGGVHPIYLNEISSDFAVRIERLPTVISAQVLMGEMYRSYCLLVQKHKTKNYSTPVKKAVLMIDADISADISLRTLASAQNINASYLSSVFKQETGKTVTEYINNKRMHLASQLLETTTLQIQTVALHCGIMDVQYFSKLFKKHFGKTPKEYREENKKSC